MAARRAQHPRSILAALHWPDDGERRQHGRSPIEALVIAGGAARALLQRRVRALYRWNGAGRMLAVNQWDGGVAPRCHVMRCPSGPACWFRGDVGERAAAALTHLCRQEPAASWTEEYPAQRTNMLAVLAASAPIDGLHGGPVFGFPRDLTGARGHGDVRAIVPDNADLLRGGLEAWLPDVVHRQPMLALVEAGRAVALCASARIGEYVHEAGVETHPAHRGHGHARTVVAAWAGAVRRLGCTPVYSTSWDNVASRGVAAGLGLEWLAVDFHVT